MRYSHPRMDHLQSAVNLLLRDRPSERATDYRLKECCCDSMGAVLKTDPRESHRALRRIVDLRRKG